MPVAFRHKGFRFAFYSNEGDPREPPHVHAIKNGVDAKFWLSPEIVVAYNDGFNSRTLRELTELVSERRDFIVRAWDEFFGEA